MLTGKIALVTGASKGIGKAIAQKFAESGATVIVNYNGSQEAAQEVVDEIVQQGGIAEAMQCNVTDDEASRQMVKSILDKYRRIDILVNNAGITRDNLIMCMSEQDFDQVLDTNLKGSFHMIRHFARTFIKQRSGKIINISSVSGRLGNAGQANYSASKAGVIGLTKSVAREFAGRGICVNAIAPGFIDTEMTRVMPEEAKRGLMQMIPLGRVGSVTDVANLALFLASSSSDYITGQVISVDGGMYM